MDRSKKTVIAVVGPTAVGKTAMAIRLATHFQTEILSADSRQCFRELNIGVARPSKEELQKVTHHFIADRSILENFTAADYETFALTVADQVFEHHDQLILVGGTGLYIRSFLNGLDVIPEVDASVREGVMQLYASGGMEALQEELKRVDTEFSSQGEMQNPQRMMRALEVFRSTGKSILSFRTGSSKTRPFVVKWVGLQLPREVLVERINLRVDEMMVAGWLEEAKQVFPYRHLNALQTVGYKELFDHLDGKYSLEEAVERIKISTRQYAKRQMTWFRGIPEIEWFDPTDVPGVLQAVSK